MLNFWISWSQQTVQTQKGAVSLGSTLFASLSVLLDTSKCSQSDLVKLYVNYEAKAKYIW